MTMQCDAMGGDLRSVFDNYAFKETTLIATWKARLLTC